MKRFLKIFGLVLLLLIVGGSAITAYTIHQGNKLDQESRQYVETVLPKMLSVMTTENFLQYLDPDMKAKMDPKNADRKMALYQKLGKFKSLSDLKGDANISLSKDGHIVTAFYTANAEFEISPAHIILKLIKKDNQWAVTSIEIRSNLLLELQAAEHPQARSLMMPQRTPRRVDP
jgi:hypothetical protein